MEEIETASPVRQAYAEPLLRHLGDIRQQTLGGSGCVSDSTGLAQRPIGGCP